MHECFRATLRRRHDVAFFRCTACGFVQTEEPYWLDEAYAEPINAEDTGLLQRNIRFAELSTIILFTAFDPGGIFVDYAGGLGVFTRLMRDAGFDFYWHDPHAQNVHARGFSFEPSNVRHAEAVTSFESFEHFVDPAAELERMMQFSKNILFSTLFIPSPLPAPGEWSYYGVEHGQHVSFFTEQACRALARRFGLAFHTFGELHLFTEKPISDRLINALFRKKDWGVLWYIRSKLHSKTESDSSALRSAS
jgi:hypothetical protein